MTSLLSVKPIDPKDRLIVALDVPDAEAARALVIDLGDAAAFYKIGLELFMTSGYFELLEWLVGQGKKVFVDLKFFDVPETVRAAVRALAGSGATFATIHGNQAIMEAAVKDKGSLKILAVTVLTSLDRGDLDDLGFACEVEQLVLSRARRALAAGDRVGRRHTQEARTHLLVERRGVRIGQDDQPLHTAQARLGYRPAQQRGADAMTDRRRIDEQLVELDDAVEGQRKLRHAERHAVRVDGDPDVAARDRRVGHDERLRAPRHEIVVVAPVSLRARAQRRERRGLLGAGGAQDHQRRAPIEHWRSPRPPPAKMPVCEPDIQSRPGTIWPL